MRERKHKIHILILIFAVFFASYYISSYNAKYKTTIVESDDTSVAKWKWTINGDVIDTYAKSVAQNAFTFNLFDTIKDSDGTSVETDVTNNKIAPGTSGSFDIDITNNSEVNAIYAITFTEQQTNLPSGVTRVPIEYSTDNEMNWTTDITTLNIGDTLINMGESADTITVNWRWVFERGYLPYTSEDDIDTDIGNSAAQTNPPSLNVTADITVIQAEEYSIRYSLNGGTVEPRNPISYTKETPSFTLNNPTKTGYTFKGWSGTGLIGDTNTTVTIPQGSTDSRVYTANWIANTYRITFNSNGGSGSMSNQTMTYDLPVNLTSNSFTRTNYLFAGWNTKADGSGTSYTDGQLVSNLTTTNGATVTLYAQWELKPDVKYAVQIYGIYQDEDENGELLGLTFGPAVGANYNNAYRTHKYEETTPGSGIYNVKIVTHTVADDKSETLTEEYLKKSSGANVERTEEEKQKYDVNIHNMSWKAISEVEDKTIFLDCMLCGDTKAVGMYLNDTIIGTTTNYTQNGDGAGVLFSSINSYYRKWNPRQSENSAVGTGVTLDSNEKNYGSNAKGAGGYSVSHIRATLIGENEKTNIGYAGDVNLSEANSLYSCIDSSLRNVITAKRIKYVTGSSRSSYSLNNDIVDKIWLFSEREMYGTGGYSGNTTEGIGASGVGYNKFANTESKYYMSSYNTNDSKNRVVYYEAGSARYWWLRSPNLSSTHRSRYVLNTGNFSTSYAYNTNIGGLGFGLCIK